MTVRNLRRLGNAASALVIETIGTVIGGLILAVLL